MDRIIGNIFETKDYGMFKTLEGNREDYEARAQKIILSIKSRGYILSPICINEKQEVIDGQGRLCALKQLGMPVHYYTATGAGINECIAMNIYGTKWQLIDYVRSYARRGFEDYKKLLQLNEKYSAISFNTILSITCNIMYGKNRGRDIQNGHFKISDENFLRADDVLSFCEEARPYFSWVIGRKDYLYLSFNFLLGKYYHGEFDRKRMIEAIRLHGKTLMPEIATIQSALNGLSDIYNYKKKNNKVYFATEYDKALREQIPNYEKIHKNKE